MIAAPEMPPNILSNDAVEWFADYDPHDIDKLPDSTPSAASQTNSTQLPRMDEDGSPKTRLTALYLLKRIARYNRKEASCPSKPAFGAAVALILTIFNAGWLP